MNRTSFLLALALCALIALACSAGVSSPLAPELSGAGLTSSKEAAAAGTSKALWGYWQIIIDTQTWLAEIVPLRSAEYAVNVVTFLQPPAGNPASLSIKVTDATDWFSEGKISVDVGLRHPFPGYDIYTGFDVYGVFVSPGSISGQYDSDVIYTNGDGESILLNADGYTRWMNPSEFGVSNKIFDFTIGRLGTQNISLFTSTINGYKYFADNLDKDEDVGHYLTDAYNVEGRGWFKAGSFNTREYDLKFPIVGDVPQLEFQYAVIASWVEPDEGLTGDPDTLDIPGDFFASANADEAIYLGISDNSTLYYVDGSGGGAISLELEVYDWGALADGVKVADEIYRIVVEGPGSAVPGGYAVFDQATLAATAGAGTCSISSVFEVEISNCTPGSNDAVPVLITVESFAPESFDPGTGVAANEDRLAAYFRYDAAVGSELPSEIVVTSPNGGETLWMAMSEEITWDPGSGGVGDVVIEWSTDDFGADIRTIVASTENDGSYLWAPIPNVETDTAKVRIRAVAGTDEDESDDYFSIALPVWLDCEEPVVVDNGTVSFSWWPHYHWGNELSPAMAQATDGTVWVVWGNNNTQTDDTQIHSSDGINWSGTGNCFGTGGPNYRDDMYKAAPGQDTWVYCTIMPYKTGLTVMNRLYYAAWNYNFDAGPSYQNNEIAVDQAGYIYVFGDSTPGITVKRSNNANDAHSCSFWGTVTTSGEVSHVRSWARVGNGLALAWFTTTGEIRVAFTSDPPTNQNWGTSELVFDGSGYANVRDPGLAVDPDGRLHLCFVGRNTASSQYELRYARRETDGTWGESIQAISSSDDISDAHIDFAEVNDLEVLLVAYETEGQVRYVLSPSAGLAFLPPGEISPASETAYDPDIIVTDPPYNFDTVCFYAFDDGTGSGDIAWVNADFETP
jgi:hypothetical protein